MLPRSVINFTANNLKEKNSVIHKKVIIIRQSTGLKNTIIKKRIIDVVKPVFINT